LARIAAEINRPAWSIDDAHQTVTRLTGQPLDLNSIAKGYIIRRAVAAARREVPQLQRLLLNLGGDMFALGRDAAARPAWMVGVQDPLHPEDNAPVLSVLRLQDQAVAVSGGSVRFYTIAGRRYSHLFDPRTGRPASDVAGATAVAPDNVTANALATTLCVLDPVDGLRLVAETPGAECLVVTADGRQLRSPGFHALERTPRSVRAATDAAGAPAGAWPEGYQMNLTVTLPNIAAGGRYRSPYVVVWAENADGKVVRTIAL
jgi:thiamine biosynthesis lipoprotein ApbE